MRLARCIFPLWLCLLAIPAVPQDSPKTAKPFAFEVVSLRPHKQGSDPLGRQYLPDGYRLTGSLAAIIQMAYVPQPLYSRSPVTLLHDPDWMHEDWYDIEARVAPEDMPAWQQARQYDGDSALLRSALQAVLKERCKLELHITPVAVPYLNIVAGKHGTKLQATVPGAIKRVDGKTSQAGKGFLVDSDGKRQFVGVSMDDLAIVLMRLDSSLPVQNKTGLTGRYDFSVPWFDYRSYPGSEMPNNLDRMPLSSVGLELKLGTGPGYLIDIDHIERPEPN